MKRQFKWWPWGALTSTGAAVFLALLVPLGGGNFQPADFSAVQFGLRVATYFLLCFWGAWGLLGILRLTLVFWKRLFRWKNFKWLLGAFGIFLLLIPLLTISDSGIMMLA